MTMMSRVSQFLLGFILAIALLFLAGAGLTRYLLTRLSVPPPRPSFQNDPSPSPETSPESPAASPAPSPAAAASPAASPSPSPASQGYRARVTQPIGLILRQDPNTTSVQIGGIEFNQEVVVLEESTDGSWQRIRTSSNAEGWVKGGNTQRID